MRRLIIVFCTLTICLEQNPNANVIDSENACKLALSISVRPKSLNPYEANADDPNSKYKECVSEIVSRQDYKIISRSGIGDVLRNCLDVMGVKHDNGEKQKKSAISDETMNLDDKITEVVDGRTRCLKVIADPKAAVTVISRKELCTLCTVNHKDS